MSLKIFTSSSGNQFYMIDTDDNRLYEGLSKDVIVRRKTNVDTSFYFKNVNGFNESKEVPFASIQDEAGAPYADIGTFISFYEENTGFSEGGASSIPTELMDDLLFGGWGDDNDLATSTTPIDLVNGGYVVLTNDKQGSNTSTEFAPSFCSSIFDPITNQFDWSFLRRGDRVELRVDTEVLTGSPNQEITLEMFMRVGAPLGEYTLFFQDIVEKSTGTHKIFAYSGIYLGDVQTSTYPAELRMFSDGTGTVKVLGWYWQITRKGL